MFYYPTNPAPDRHRAPSYRIMTVEGSDAVAVKPDRADVELGVITQAMSLTEAQETNAETMNQVIQSLQQLGIPPEMIQTIDYSIQPQYDYVDGKQEFRGYQVTHMLSVKIAEINQTGTVIDTAVQNGANRVLDINFTVNHPSLYYQQALTLALENAAGKARAMTEKLGVKLDPVPIKIAERNSDSPDPFNTAVFKTQSASATPVEPGQLEIKATVDVQYHYFA
ncbi:SIMPL domain-containing protein [Thalassobacillus sp. CUG 92003]|uniref:SIMPL domain-containing protein n=1 Tax=Thalassobacillus sp. CUG 92003 TaxID=2736641 RepID=UPI0015E63886|nr:SIMPL domain-containing protein [Thalassobacillus sp. CUG 92003]